MSLLSPQLSAFVMVVKHKTVHAAAKSMHLTQTAVTQRIRSLEKQLATTLFIRSRRGMELTHEGQALLRYCNASKVLEGEALAHICGAAISTETEIRITGPSSTMGARIIPIAENLIKTYPHLLFRFILNDIENRHEFLRRGECDFAVISKEELSDELDYKKLTPEEYVLVCSAKWGSRNLTEILKQEHIIDYDETDVMTFNYLKYYELFDLANVARHYSNSPESIAQLVATGVGYTTLTKEIAEPYIKDKKLILLNNNRVYQYQPILAWYPRHEMPKYMTDIIKAIA